MTKIIRLALEEDIGAGDVTSRACVPEGLRARGTFLARESLILAGTEVLDQMFDHVVLLKHDGDRCAHGDILATVEGNARTLLERERVSLNFLQRLSGVATLARQYADAVAGTNCRVLDTRKTTPGMRALEKRAAAAGGVMNHRMGLFDAILIKNNHIAAAGGVRPALQNAGLTAHPAPENPATLPLSLVSPTPENTAPLLPSLDTTTHSENTATLPSSPVPPPAENPAPLPTSPVPLTPESPATSPLSPVPLTPKSPATSPSSPVPPPAGNPAPLPPSLVPTAHPENPAAASTGNVGQVGRGTLWVRPIGGALWAQPTADRGIHSRPIGLPIEIEVRTLAELHEALDAGAQHLLLDNLTPAEAAAWVREIAGRATVELSGGITLETVRAYAETGADFVSAGAITHSARAVDISFRLELL